MCYNVGSRGHLSPRDFRRDIALAYYSIPVTLVYFVRKRKDLAFDWMFLCFAAFIVACGTTHVMEIFNIWHPTYWLSGVIKVDHRRGLHRHRDPAGSSGTRALALPSPSQLRKSNEDLQREIRDRKEAPERAQRLTRSW